MSMLVHKLPMPKDTHTKTCKDKRKENVMKKGNGKIREEERKKESKVRVT
jgi:hypothetical protein